MSDLEWKEEEKRRENGKKSHSNDFLLGCYVFGGRRRYWEKEKRRKEVQGWAKP